VFPSHSIRWFRARMSIGNVQRSLGGALHHLVIIWHIWHIVSAATQSGLKGPPDACPPHPERSDGADGTIGGRSDPRKEGLRSPQ
jgi:hypothetical protein